MRYFIVLLCLLLGLASLVAGEEGYYEPRNSGDGSGDDGGSGEEPTTVAPSTTTVVTTISDVTTTVAEPDLIKIELCIELYFPCLWLLQTLFAGLFDFCPIFEGQLCDAIESAGARCWVSKPCDADCEADYDIWDENGDVNVAQVDSSTQTKLGCFDLCVEVHFTADTFGVFQDDTAASNDTSARFAKIVRDVPSFNFEHIQNMITEMAQEAVVHTVIAGPGQDALGDDATTDGGYTCLDGSAPAADSDQLTCLVEDSEANNFDVGCDGIAADQCEVSQIAPAVTNVDITGSATSGAISGINCAVNNGGCSHTCSGVGLDGTCSCPNDCWAINGDALSCSIKPEMVELVCLPDSMQANLAKCVVAGLTDFKLGNSVCTENTDVNGNAAANGNNVIKDGACTDTSVVGMAGDVDGDGVDDSGCLAFGIKLDECSTAVDANYATNEITFTQQLSSIVTITNEQSAAMQSTLNDGILGGLISREPRVAIDFKCQYTSDYTTDIAAVETASDDVNNDLLGSGKFGFSLETMQPSSDDFDDLTTTWDQYHSTQDGNEYTVGHTLYFRICSQQDLSNIYFSVPDCTVKNHNETESYKIIDNHCPDPFVNTVREGRVHQDRFQTWKAGETFTPMPTGSTLVESDRTTDQCLMFSYTVFEFISNANESSDLKLTCNVKACEYSDVHPDAMAPCVDGACPGGANGRKRRSLFGKREKYSTVSQTFRVTQDLNVQD